MVPLRHYQHALYLHQHLILEEQLAYHLKGHTSSYQVHRTQLQEYTLWLQQHAIRSFHAAANPKQQALNGCVHTT